MLTTWSGRKPIFMFAMILFSCCIWFNLHSVHEILEELQKCIMYEELQVKQMLHLNDLKLKIKEINMKREVRNCLKFGPVFKETVIVVVQVNRDIKGLQYLIISLGQVRYIESVLLIFSHSYYSDCINRLIRSIDFCKVMQIFYPHSVQLHPNRFPGIDSEDCINGSQTILQHCQQRDANLTERKHHWWWKAYFIFDQMEWSPRHTGSVIFLEEDQYVAPDLLHTLRYMQRSLSYFPDVEIMSLGTMYEKNVNTQLLTIKYWKPSFDVGIAFNKTTWNKIVDLSSFYCTYDDCSWSYSLLNVFKNFPNGDVNMVASIAPRVIVLKQFNNVPADVVRASRTFSNIGLFPEKVTVVLLYGSNGRIDSKDEFQIPKGNGGWTNIKDHLLCLEPLSIVSEGYNATAMNVRYDQYSG